MIGHNPPAGIDATFTFDTSMPMRTRVSVIVFSFFDFQNHRLTTMGTRFQITKNDHAFNISQNLINGVCCAIGGNLVPVVSDKPLSVERRSTPDSI